MFCRTHSGTPAWLYWQTMFALSALVSALEMKRYLCRYVHHIDGLPVSVHCGSPNTTVKHDHLVRNKPWRRSKYGMDVKNVIIETVGSKKVAKQIV